jgi:hypothetical protein
MSNFSDESAKIGIFGYPNDKVVILPSKAKTYQQYGHRGH